jgi:hypothetical protein
MNGDLAIHSCYMNPNNVKRPELLKSGLHDQEPIQFFATQPSATIMAAVQ